MEGVQVEPSEFVHTKSAWLQLYMKKTFIEGFDVTGPFSS
jgi:hypothetical protein